MFGLTSTAQSNFVPIGTIHAEHKLRIKTRVNITFLTNQACAPFDFLQEEPGLSNKIV